MKVLILSCNTGGGHNAAASALKESLNFYHHEAEVLDLMSLGRKHTSALVGGAYVKLVSVFPAGFGALYQLGELVRKFPWKSPVYYANARLGNVLADYIDQNHFNAVVTTHLYPAETLTWMKQKGRLTIPCVAVATDYACIPFWEETNCDYYVVPHKDLIPEFASCGIPEEKLLPLGIPVRPAFARPASKEDVRRHLGLPENAPLFLVMSGSMGFGKVHLLAHELVSRLENGEQAVIICGNNKKRMRSLRLQFHKNPNVHIIGFTRHVAEYMAAADVQGHLVDGDDAIFHLDVDVSRFDGLAAERSVTDGPLHGDRRVVTCAADVDLAIQLAGNILYWQGRDLEQTGNVAVDDRRLAPQERRFRIIQ